MINPQASSVPALLRRQWPPKHPTRSFRISLSLNKARSYKLFCVGDVGFIPFAVFAGFQFQLVTRCNQLIALVH